MKNSNYRLKELRALVDLSKPTPLKVCFPILLDGDLVMSSEHLGIAYLTSILRQAKADCKIVEIPIRDIQKGCTKIVDWKPNIIGITLTTISVDNAIQLGRSLRENLKMDVFILAGGPLATHLKGKLLSIKGWEFLDALIYGEGEIPILRIAEAIHTAKDISDVPNLAFRKGVSVLENPSAELISDLDQLPEPARDQIEQHHANLSYVRISTSRGCTSRCKFCNAPHTRNRLGHGKIWRGASPERVVDEVERIYHKYKVDTFDFVDSTFEDPGGTPQAKNRIKRIADELIRRNLKIYYNCCFQAKNWYEEDIPLLKRLWESGWEKVLVGIESGSEAGLRRWGKLSSVEDNKRVISLLRDMNVYVAFGFISFHPWSTFGEIRENIHFLRYNMGYNLRRYTVRLELYPGAEVIDSLRDERLLHPKYDETLSPFGYQYKDDRVKKLASHLNLLYGETYEKKCTIDKEPAVFKFETYDIVLHTYRSRLARHLKDLKPGKEILKECNEEIEALKQQLTEFNYSFISQYVDLAEKDRLSSLSISKNRKMLEDYYKKKINDLQSIQLKASMRLHREGYSVRSMLNTFK